MIARADEQLLRHAIRLAMNGRGQVEPNPMVGCVIVKNERVIGQGFHAKYGGPHAEPSALESCTENPRGATAYVTLEPCCHLNKKTPPCVPRLIDANIERVVVGCFDPNPDVNGKGITQLREAGITVDGPCLESECRQLIAPFLLRTIHHRPYVTMKVAQTADDRVAGAGGRPIGITDEASNRIVHQLRARCDAIAVGIGTVLSDDPFLTARNVPAPKPLLRYVLDRRLRIPLDSRLVRSATDSPVIVACANASDDRARQLIARGVAVIEAASFAAVLADQYTRGVTHLLIEAGPTLAAALFAANAIDRLWIFRSNRTLDEPTAPAAATLPAHFVETACAAIGTVTLKEYLNQSSVAFFAAAPSADLLLASQ